MRSHPLPSRRALLLRSVSGPAVAGVVAGALAASWKGAPASPRAARRTR